MLGHTLDYFLLGPLVGDYFVHNVYAVMKRARP